MTARNFHGHYHRSANAPAWLYTEVLFNVDLFPHILAALPTRGLALVDASLGVRRGLPAGVCAAWRRMVLDITRSWAALRPAGGFSPELRWIGHAGLPDGSLAVAHYSSERVHLSVWSAEGVLMSTRALGDRGPPVSDHQRWAQRVALAHDGVHLYIRTVQPSTDSLRLAGTMLKLSLPDLAQVAVCPVDGRYRCNRAAHLAVTARAGRIFASGPSSCSSCVSSIWCHDSGTLSTPMEIASFAGMVRDCAAGVGSLFVLECSSIFAGSKAQLHELDFGGAQLRTIAVHDSASAAAFAAVSLAVGDCGRLFVAQEHQLLVLSTDGAVLQRVQHPWPPSGCLGRRGLRIRLSASHAYLWGDLPEGYEARGSNGHNMQVLKLLPPGPFAWVASPDCACR